MSLTPEQQARKNIDYRLRLAEEIIESLEAGLENFKEIMESLNGN